MEKPRQYEGDIAVTQEAIDQELLSLKALFPDAGVRSEEAYVRNLDLARTTRDIERLKKPLNPDRKPILIHLQKSLSELYTEHEGLTGIDTDIVHLGAFAAALFPKEWEKACKDEGYKHLAKRAHPNFLAPEIGEIGGVIPLVLRGKKHFQKKSRNMLAQTLETEGSDTQILSEYYRRLRVAGLVYLHRGTVDLLSSFHEVCSTSELKNISNLAQKLQNNFSRDAALNEKLQSHIELATAANRFVGNRKARVTIAAHSDMLEPLIRMQSRNTREVINNLNAVRNVLLQTTGKHLGSVILEQQVDVSENQNNDSTSEAEDQGRVAQNELFVLKNQAEAIKKELAEVKQRRLESELYKRIEALAQHNDQLQSPWKLSNRTLKKRGLSEGIAAIVKGIHNNDGIVVLPGHNKTEAYALASQIEYLKELAANNSPEDIADYLGAQCKVSDTLLGQLEDIKRQISNLHNGAAEKARQQLPDVFNTEGALTYITGNWPGLSLLITQYWPDGKQTASNIEKSVIEPYRSKSLFSKALNSNEAFGNNDEAEIEPATYNELPASEHPESNDSYELMDNGSILPLDKLHNIALQLDAIILPPQATIDDLKKAIYKLDIDSEQAEQIDWERLHNLVRVRDIYEGEIYRSKKGSLGNAPPYFVVEFTYEGETYAVAESPVEGNATYVVAEKQVGGSWLEVLSLSKKEARILGAHRIIHASKQKAEHHLRKINDRLLDLIVTSPEN